jgi:hypothetical protein
MKRFCSFERTGSAIAWVRVDRPNHSGTLNVCRRDSEFDRDVFSIRSRLTILINILLRLQHRVVVRSSSNMYGY